MGAVIHCDGLTKRYGNVDALHDLNVDVHDGEVLGFLGPNGAGKTTTIRLLLGLIRPTSGHAELFGLHAERDAFDRRFLMIALDQPLHVDHLVGLSRWSHPRRGCCLL